MKTLHNNKPFLVFSVVFSLAFLAGCGSARHNAKSLGVNPALPNVLVPDSTSKVNLDLTFTVPERYFSKRSRLVITPSLIAGDTVCAQYRPLVVDAPIYEKKKRRVQVLEGYQDPYDSLAVSAGKRNKVLEIPYSQTITLPENIVNGNIVAVVSVDGCGKCSGIDTVDVAGISNPVTLMPEPEEAIELNWIDPEFVIRPKIMEGRGVANLQFGINSNDINLSLGNNRAELETAVRTLQPLLQDTLSTLTSLSIYGMASADGSLKLNEALAKKRADSAKKWLLDRLEADSRTRGMVKTGSRPEGWQPVLEAMIADGNRDSAAVKHILEKYSDENDDVQEYFIRRLPCWGQIREKYLQKARKVEYLYTYSVKSFTTDAELLEMYGKRPDAFSESELLRVASITEEYDGKKAVYQTIMRYFPQSKTAANNLAVLYLRENNVSEARKVLYSLEEFSPETLNALAASYIYAEDYERAISLLQDVGLPEARYNLGLLKAKQRHLREAYNLLYPFRDVNSAISALSVNENKEARKMLEESDDHSPVADYARCLVYARLKDDEAFFRYIENACAEEPLRTRAASEPDFKQYHSQERFIRIVDRH